MTIKKPMKVKMFIDNHSLLGLLNSPSPSNTYLRFPVTSVLLMNRIDGILIVIQFVVGQ